MPGRSIDPSVGRPVPELIKKLGLRTKIGILFTEARAAEMSAGELAELAVMLARDLQESAQLIHSTLYSMSAAGIPDVRREPLRQALEMIPIAPAPAAPAAQPSGDALPTVEADSAPASSGKQRAVSPTQRTQRISQRFRVPFESQPAPKKGQPTVVLAEDDAPLRKTYRDGLENKGFNVLEAFDGLEAWNIIQNHPSLDAVILDMKMPGLHGLEVLGRISKSGKDVPVVVCTGYENIAAEYQVITYPKLRFVTKPTTPGHLAKVLINLLAESN